MQVKIISIVIISIPIVVVLAAQKLDYFWKSNGMFSSVMCQHGRVLSLGAVTGLVVLLTQANIFIRWQREANL
eukprot:2479160-Amphidinium_carterae.1